LSGLGLFLLLGTIGDGWCFGEYGLLAEVDPFEVVGGEFGECDALEVGVEVDVEVGVEAGVEVDEVWLVFVEFFEYARVGQPGD